MKQNFLLCGSAGWCLEIFWTGFHALLSGEPTMTGKTSREFDSYLNIKVL